MKADRFIDIGELGKTVGLKGAISIIQWTSFPERFEKMETFFLTKEKKVPKNLTVERLFTSGRKLCVKFTGIDSIHDAVKLKGYRITIEKDSREELPEDTFYHDDLIGCDVYDQNDVKVGTIKNVIEQSVNDLYVLDCNGEEVLVPAVKEFVKSIDINSKKVNVHFIEGMLP